MPEDKPPIPDVPEDQPAILDMPDLPEPEKDPEMVSDTGNPPTTVSIYMFESEMILTSK